MIKKVVRGCELCLRPVVTTRTFTDAKKADEWTKQATKEGVICSECSGWDEFERSDKK